ncbi:MAG: CD1247 N-terminal domain-containing protein [Candidatus Onthomonas sp.]
MSLTEKTAYLRGLLDGMGIKAENSDEHKLLAAIVDVMDDIAANVEANNESITSLADELDELDDAVTELEEILEDDDDEEDEAEEDEEVEYQLDCPECGSPIILDEDTIASGETVCPHCNQKLTIDVGFEDEEESGAEDE